jgi:hypothetical protein
MNEHEHHWRYEGMNFARPPERVERRICTKCLNIEEGDWGLEKVETSLFKDAWYRLHGIMRLDGEYQDKDWL